MLPKVTHGMHFLKYIESNSKPSIQIIWKATGARSGEPPIWLIKRGPQFEIAPLVIYIYTGNIYKGKLLSD